MLRNVEYVVSKESILCANAQYDVIFFESYRRGYIKKWSMAFPWNKKISKLFLKKSWKTDLLEKMQ